MGSGNAFGEMIFELRPGVQGRVENFEPRDPTGTGKSSPTWPLLLADSNIVPRCGFRHLLCAELLHLGKALIRSGKCPPSEGGPAMLNPTPSGHFLLFPSLSPQSSVPSPGAEGGVGFPLALPIHLSLPWPFCAL